MLYFLGLMRYLSTINISYQSIVNIDKVFHNLRLLF